MKGRLTLHPDCGFAPGSAADIPIDEAYRKLCNEVAAPQILRERYT
jgi:5-methyltetrahydropteroyltriglutamate--homocysteine methyltransferase